LRLLFEDTGIQHGSTRSRVRICKTIQLLYSHGVATDGQRPGRFSSSPMKITILGTRGIPGRYGGFETLADELSKRLVRRGHQVTVYCRKPFVLASDIYDQRIHRVILSTISNKHFDTLFHSFLSIVHAVFSDADVILICNVANSPFAWIPRLVGKPTALNVDGLDRKRRKWNFLGQWFLYACEILSSFTPTQVVT